MENFSIRLSRQMDFAGVDRRELSERTGCGHSAIAKWLKGSLTPKSEQLLGISRALGVTMEWLLTGEGPKTLGDAHGAVLKRVASEATNQEDFDQRLAEITPLVDEINTLRESLRKIEAEAKRVVEESVQRMIRTTPREYDFRAGRENLEAENSPTLPFVGQVAAGSPLSSEFEEVVKVSRDYGEGYFVVEVNGASMEPELQDGDLIVVKGSDAYTPANGRVCVVSDGTGSSVKKWNRRAGLFESLNPDFPDLEPTEDLVFQGYYVEKV